MPCWLSLQRSNICLACFSRSIKAIYHPYSSVMPCDLILVCDSPLRQITDCLLPVPGKQRNLYHTQAFLTVIKPIPVRSGVAGYSWTTIGPIAAGVALLVLASIPRRSLTSEPEPLPRLEYDIDEIGEYFAQRPVAVATRSAVVAFEALKWSAGESMTCHASPCFSSQCSETHVSLQVKGRGDFCYLSIMTGKS